VIRSMFARPCYLLYLSVCYTTVVDGHSPFFCLDERILLHARSWVFAVLLLPAHYLSFFFFFFQAEDGIRDATVTGVQTCALPILAPMRAVARVAALALATGLTSVPPSSPLAAQESFVPPQPPCELTQSNSKINNGIQALRNAVEKPDQRGPQRAQAKKLLTDAIQQDNQSTSAAAWYYLGRYAVQVGDVAAADTTFARAASLAPTCAADIATHRGELWGKLLNDGLSAWQAGKQDSTVLGRLVASSQSRKGRGAKLAPGDQQLFTRDSTARAQAVARQRAALAAAMQQLAADSSALSAAFAPAIDALKDALMAYPGE